MDLPIATHIPGYHSHLWASGSSRETWPVEKSIALFLQTDLAKGLPTYTYLGRQLKMFWTTMDWIPRDTDIDVFATTTGGDWFAFKDLGAEITWGSLPVNPGWLLNVVCEKKYPVMPRYIDEGELKECTRYIGWP
jgi:hypothetical protein